LWHCLLTTGNLNNDQIFQAGANARIVAPMSGRHENLIFLKGKDGKVRGTPPASLASTRGCSILSLKHPAHQGSEALRCMDLICAA